MSRFYGSLCSTTQFELIQNTDRNA